MSELDQQVPACLFCGRSNWERSFVYTEPPKGENRFEALHDYYREFYRCCTCGHYQAYHQLDLTGIYSGSYADNLYAGDRMKQLFARINALPLEQSDNLGRVTYVRENACRHFGLEYMPRLLDVGSGLGVFPYRMQQLGWPTTALDPDPRACEHIQAAAMTETIVGDFLQIDPALHTNRRFELLSFNKVLEHVSDPVDMLAKAKAWLVPGGAVYVELPDGEAAGLIGPEREEFFVEHYHAFSAASYALLIARAGFRLEQCERLCEPSGKYTLRGFASLNLVN